jgi:ABC-type transport system involved in cytochrome c biogenesis permease subunit
VTIAVALSLVFFYAPNDADQGFIQKIFYVHVPLAIVALLGFIAASPTCARARTFGTTAPTSRSTSA